jgi:GTP-binding protein HflX
MNYDTQEVAEKAILVQLITQKVQRSRINPTYSLEELTRLAETAGVEVLSSLVQNREVPDSAWFVGKGKVQEIKAIADELDATTIIFDDELAGSQVRNLEQALDLKIIDRTQLILDIFAQRAKTREGIIQVELAQLSYLLPRLSGQGKNLSRLGGGIGTRGPGETKLETDRRHIRERIDDLKRQLKEVTAQRELYRQRRRKNGVTQVSLVGYTNAGKSTILRALTAADVLVENQLFATLDPTSRMLRLPSGKEIILTDTVGFIQNLPTELIAAFRSTLEEVAEADLILHVIDSSSPMRNDQIVVVEQLLTDLGAADKPEIRVFNKYDLVQVQAGDAALIINDETVPYATLAAHETDSQDVLHISAYHEADLERLLQAITAKLTKGARTYVIPAARGDLLASVYRLGEVTEQSVNDTGEDLILKVIVGHQEDKMYGYQLRDYEA